MNHLSYLSQTVEGMIHPNTELKYINCEQGNGIVATRLIPAGTITWVKDSLDREFTLEDIQNFEPALQNIIETYTFRNNKGNYVLCWDNGRFVNHSFKANCVATPYGFELAIRDIQPGEQITNDYGYLNIVAPFETSDEGTLRKVVYPDDLLTYHKHWDKQIQSVFFQINKVEQALMPFLSEQTIQKIEQILNMETALDSILLNYYDAELVNSN